MTTRPGTPRAEQLAELQSVRFRLMTELGRGATPMREVNDAFERAVRDLAATHPGHTLAQAVERAVRAEFAGMTEVA